jgi:hypothetical protein
MTKFVARRGQLGLALEATRGTPVNPTIWMPIENLAFKESTEEARESQGQGVIADSDSKYVVMKMAEGEVEAQIYDQALGLILIGVVGSSPVTTGANPYTHTFTLTQTNQAKSLSLYWKDPDRSDMYPMAMVDQFELKAEPNGIIEYTVGFKSKAAREWTSQTPSYTTLGSKFLHQHVQFKLAANIAGIAAASVISLKSLELKINKNVEYDAVMGTVEPEDILNHQLSIEGTLELNLEDDTYRDYMLNGTYRAMEIKLNNGTSSTLTLQFPRVDFSQWDPDYTLNNIAKQKINFKCNYDAANAQDIFTTCTLINTKSSY